LTYVNITMLIDMPFGKWSSTNYYFIS